MAKMHLALRVNNREVEALAEPRTHSLLALAPDAVVVLDEPEQLRSAAPISLGLI